MGIQNLWVFKCVGTHNWVGTQKLWVLEHVAGTKKRWIFKKWVGTQN